MPKLRTKAARDGIDLAPPPVVKIPLPKGWQTASEALDRIEAVSTIFPDFNRATRCGGLPVNRMHTVHGPTHGGKTAFILGLIKSFVDGGHYAAYVDAEHATPQEFAAELIGELERHPNFLAKRPRTYEETIDGVEQFLTWMMEIRAKDATRKCIVVIDSINKLQPERELKHVLKDGGDEIAKGHAGRYRAAVNQSWLNHLSPRLKDAGCAMVFIAQERDDGSGEAWEADGGVDIKGGQALKFDATMLIRVSKSISLHDSSSASEKNKRGDVIGFAHRVRIYKSKVSHLDGAWTDAVFHLSNGKQTPPGFDIARDAIYVARKLGVITLAGSWLGWSKKRWQGEAKCAQWLLQNQTALQQLLAEINERTHAARKK